MSADPSTEQLRRRYAQARDQGSQARRNSARDSACPYRGDTKLVRDLAQEWRKGWREADMAIKAGKR